VTGIASTGSGSKILDNYLFDVKGYGVEISGSTNDGTIVKDNTILRAAKGFQMGGTNWLAENNTVTDLRQGSTGLDSDYARAFGTGGIFRGNTLCCSNSAYLGRSHVDCVQSFNTKPTDAGLHNTVFENNLCGDAHQGFFFNFAYTVENITMRNNLIIRTRSWATNCTKVNGCYFYNNTLAHHGAYGFGCGSGSTCEAFNNIFYNVHQGYAPLGTITRGYNLYYLCKTCPVGETGSINGSNPLFVDVGSSTIGAGAPWDGDFHLQSTSPAINAGTPLGSFSVDSLGVTRPRGAAWDIGAYEDGYSRSPRPRPHVHRGGGAHAGHDHAE
jgi:hypothetical protein